MHHYIIVEFNYIDWTLEQSKLYAHRSFIVLKNKLKNIIYDEILKTIDLGPDYNLKYKHYIISLNI